MKRGALLICFLFLVKTLCSCGIDANPIENPQVDDFEELYIGDDYTVLVKSDIEPDALYHRAAYGFGYGDESCHVGGYEEANYMFLYKGSYYDIVEFNKFKIATCNDLTEMGVKGELD